MSSNTNSPEISGFIGATFDPSPKADFIIPNAVNTDTDDDLDILSTTELKSFKTRFGTVDTIAGAKSVGNVLTENIQFSPDGTILSDDIQSESSENEPTGVDSIGNFWGFESSEVNGIDGLTGLDVSNGIDNAISVDAYFGTTLNQEGVPGQDNEIFIMEAFGDDSILVLPLDEGGNRIGDFKLEINTGKGNSLFDTQGNFVSNIKDIGDWGDTGIDIAANIDFTSGGVLDDISMVGVAFDLSDFQGTGTLTSIAGIRVQGTGVNSGLGSVDPAVIGYNTQATDDIQREGEGEENFPRENDIDLLDGENSSKSLFGGNSDDTFIGSGENDDVFSDASNDTIAGASGVNRFIFSSNRFFMADDFGIDFITDFKAGTDKILLEQEAFTTLTSTVDELIDPDKFAIVANDTDAAISYAFITYSTGTGNLFYNENGVDPGWGTGDQFATFKDIPILSAEDIIIV